MSFTKHKIPLILKSQNCYSSIFPIHFSYTVPYNVFGNRPSRLEKPICGKCSKKFVIAHLYVWMAQRLWLRGHVKSMKSVVQLSKFRVIYEIFTTSLFQWFIENWYMWFLCWVKKNHKMENIRYAQFAKGYIIGEDMRGIPMKINRFPKMECEHNSAQM